VTLFVGTNGSGKTTTIAKLAARHAAAGERVLLAAADTFRAAAIEQLAIWAERAGVEMVAHAPGADPGAVVFDALDAAVARGADLDLVTMGVGEVDPPPSVADRVHDLGFLPDDEAADAFAAAAAYVQPSRNESFSRTVMEAWMAGTPVLANAESAVVAWHCERSGAGITWTGVDELSAAIEALAVSPSAFEALAAPGRSYVLEHYTWPTVLDHMEASLAQMPWSGGS
jgi:ABC-type cobalamin/Fe3+-siderophores transport system ATPase subunit